MAKSAPDRPKRPPLTDAERHQRFVDTAREVGADENPETFDRAFASVTTPKPQP
jgi:hypothetical protein